MLNICITCPSPCTVQPSLWTIGTGPVCCFPWLCSLCLQGGASVDSYQGRPDSGGLPCVWQGELLRPGCCPLRPSGPCFWLGSMVYVWVLQAGVVPSQRHVIARKVSWPGKWNHSYCQTHIFVVVVVTASIVFILTLCLCHQESLCHGNHGGGQEIPGWNRCPRWWNESVWRRKCRARCAGEKQQYYTPLFFLPDSVNIWYFR